MRALSEAEMTVDGRIVRCLWHFELDGTWHAIEAQGMTSSDSLVPDMHKKAARVKYSTRHAVESW